jgi:glycosyltransferase involved in cell wall biosynthesis
MVFLCNLGDFMLERINLQAPINSLGYGVVGYNIWKSFKKFGVETTLWPMASTAAIAPPCATDTWEETALQESIHMQAAFDPNAPCLKIWHEFALAERVGKGPYFAYPFFEINKFDTRRLSNLNSVDTLFVASQWAKKICLQNGVTVPIFVNPCGVDTEIFYPNKTQTDKCVFFNCGKWEQRKGHDILHEAFKKAFSNGENVELWMMTENPFLNENEKNYWESMYKAPNIKMIPRVQYQQELARIMAKTDCGVFPARSEGWNLELLEMMAMGKDVITTNYSAHTEFCKTSNSMLIEIDSEEVAYDGKWFMGDVGTWASINDNAFEQLVTHLRDFYQRWKEVEGNTFNLEGLRTAQKLTWKQTAKNFVGE